ncbi:MAG: PD-(D/E)XK nuclease family protein, partial [Bacteroidota bacterium]
VLYHIIKEPVRVSFIKKMQHASWSLVTFINENNWSLQGIEINLNKQYHNVSLKARADLVLKRAEELVVLDLKWKGLNRRKEEIRNLEDLQLTFYVDLLSEENKQMHSAYFIISRAQIIARNNLAFKEATAVSPKLDHEAVHQLIINKIEKTLEWRMQQLQKGQIEVRCNSTQKALEEHYGDQLLDLLEMKSSNAFFDDYAALIGRLD